MLHTRNNTDGNKLVIFSGIALYYGDTYIIATYFNLWVKKQVEKCLHQSVCEKFAFQIHVIGKFTCKIMILTSDLFCILIKTAVK